MRVAIFAQDDSVASCLPSLAAQQGIEVLGLIAGGAKCPAFAARCVELGFDFSTLGSSGASVLDGFKPEVLVCLAEAGSELPATLASASCPRKYTVKSGFSMSGAPWPEFAPIWLGHSTSTVRLASIAGADPKLAVSVQICAGETAMTLRAKHTQAAASLVEALVTGSTLPEVPASEEQSKDTAPSGISLEWDEATAERYIRAHSLPPHDSARVEVPGKEDEAYFIESMEQYKAFWTKILKDHSAARDSGPKQYAADTHWYSNIGGSIVKMGDSDIHKPVKTTDKKRTAVVPGAALGSRKKLRMNEPLIGLNAQLYCKTALDSSWIGVEGPYVRRLERQLAEICGCSAAVAVQSGTAALYGAMKALGVSDPSHHVLVPAFTCAACADAVVHAGGRPIPIDCEMDSYAISLEAVRKGLDANKDVVGVVIAPCYGVPARDFNEVLALCKERGLWLCEDACESYGGMKALPPREGGASKVPVGALATLSVVSIRSEKMVGVGEGGAILGNDPTLVARAKWWCSRAPSRGVGLWRVYEHDAVGQNFRLPEMLAAVGSAAAEMLPTMIERKRKIHGWYEQRFASNPALKGIRLQKEALGDESVWWITAALLPGRLSGEKVGMQLMKNCPDIEIRPGFFPLGMMGIFKSEWVQPCPNAEALYHGLVCLPSSNQLLEVDIERVCGALAEAIEQVQSSGAEQPKQ